MSTKRRLSNEINAGSMADIAFLLLIFFLVTTTISEDKGILVKLPPYTNEPPPIVPIHENNVLNILINADNQLLVRGLPLAIDLLKAQTKNFVANPLSDHKMAESPLKAIVSLKNDRGTRYSTYIQVYNELKTAYNELWEEMALKKYHKKFEELSQSQMKTIRDAIPMVISEAESTAFGKEY